MNFEAFAARASEIESTTADLAITSLVADLFREANDDSTERSPVSNRTESDDLEILARFIQGRVFPAYNSTTLDIGPSLCYTALARAAGPNIDTNDIEDRLADVGEIGAVAANCDLGGQQGLSAFGEGANSLTVSEVDRELHTLAAVEGAGSEDRKLDIFFGLFNRCSSEEARYLSRLVLSEMRIGVGEGVVRDAISEAFSISNECVERALQLSNDYGHVTTVARDEGKAGLSAISLEIGRPVQSMLAQAGTVGETIEEWGEVGIEWKYDGARVQIHADDESVRIFSRNMEEVTVALPEIVEYVKAHLDSPAIIDGEVVAIDGSGDPLPFQEVLRRFRRKHEIERARKETTLELVVFDCLHVDGEDLLDEPLIERYEKLSTILDTGVSELVYMSDPDEIAGIEAESLEAGHEGIMLKNLDSTYSPGKRGKNWRKRKPGVETLDLVVTGGEWGEGRRATFFGTFELSVRSGETFETIGKVATGITDQELVDLTELLEPHVLMERGQTVEFQPEVVFEVGYEEIQRSPTSGSSYALRFPRFLAVRDDVGPNDADSLERVKRLAKHH